MVNPKLENLIPYEDKQIEEMPIARMSKREKRLLFTCQLAIESFADACAELARIREAIKAESPLTIQVHSSHLESWLESDAGRRVGNITVDNWTCLPGRTEFAAHFNWPDQGIVIHSDSGIVIGEDQ